MRKNSLIIVLLAGCLPVLSLAQQTSPPGYSGSAPVSFVRTWDALSPDSVTANVDVSTAVIKFKMATAYVDGLGRPIQAVVKQGSLATGTNATDLVSVLLYDEFSREQYKYLPFVANTTGGNTYVNDGFFKINPFQQDSVFNKAQFANENYYYSQTEFEPSPLNRPVKAMSAGNSWVGTSRGMESKYWINTVTDSVRIWRVTDVSGSFGSYSTSASYAAGDLSKSVTVDEDGNQVVEIKNKDGLIILKKAQLTAAADTSTGKGYYGWLSTYYIYDSSNRLRCVVQPKGVELLLANSWDITALSGDILKEQCFRYEYDQRGRMIMKKVPGAGNVWMVYDMRDRLVMKQDSAMRASHKWLYTLYENTFNRPTTTGFITDNSNYSNLSYHLVRADTSSAYPNTASYTNEELTRTFYDDYGWRSSQGNPLSSSLNTIYSGYLFSASSSWPYPQAVTKSSDTKGMVTGTKARILGTSNYLYTVSFYDDKGRTIQTQATNITDSVDIITTQYSWNGKPLLAIRKQAKGNPNAQTIVALTKFTYDSLWRVTKIEKKVSHSQVSSGSMPGYWTTIQQSEYDKLGQLSKKKLAPGYNGGAGLESLNYDYNIRGWTLGMNRSYVKDTTSTANYFGFDLGYDRDSIIINSLSRLYAAKQYNGNITGMLWKSTGDDQLRKYDFTYDAVNRILSADFNQFTATNFNKNAKIDFSMSGMSYDANGNILGMKQKGLKLASSITIDSLIYDYVANSNKLLNVIDSANDAGTKLGDFRTSTLHPNSGSKNSSTVDYTYDGNGNMVKDLNKDIVAYSGSNGIIYNYLNLPDTITVREIGADKGTIIYAYDAMGSKLRKTVYEPGVDTTITLYMDGAVYKNDTLEFISQEEGRIRRSDTLVYDYMIKDHLGNVRMLLTTEQKTNMYPAATMELADAASDTTYYSNIALTRDTLPSGYPIDNSYSNPNTRVAKVNGSGNKIGPAIVLKVMAGDKFSLQVSDWYNRGHTSPGTPTNPVSDLLTALTGSIGSVATGHATTSELQTNSILNPGAQAFYLSHNGADTTTKPKAFINWVLFDEQFNYVAANSGFEQVGGNNPVTVTPHTRTDLPVNKNGYLYIYVSNETPNVNVFFDNLQVTHVRGPELEENHYYPFGLTMSGISSKALAFGDPENKRNKFQNQEFNEDLGVDIYEFKYRMDDPQIGRFWQIDPLSDKYVYNSGYTFSENKVTGHIELEGLESVKPNWETVYEKAVRESVARSKELDKKDFVEFTGAITKGDNPTLAFKAKVLNVGFESSVTNNEFDIISIRDNKVVIGGKELSSHEHVKRDGNSFGASLGPLSASYSEITETRYVPGTVEGGEIPLSVTKTESFTVNGVTQNIVTDEKGKVSKNSSFDIFNVKVSLGVGAEASLKVNLRPANGITPPLPRYGAVDNIRVNPNIDKRKLLNSNKTP